MKSMRWLAIILMGLFLSGCREPKTIIRDGEQQNQPVGDALSALPGITPNTMVTYPHWLNKEILEIDFLAYKINAMPVFGTAVNLTYDSQVLEYDNYRAGDFLERGGVPTGNQKPVYLVSSAVSTEKEKNELIIGASLFHGSPGSHGSGKLLTLRFKSKKSAPTQIIITKGKLKNLQAGDINEVHWPSSISIPDVAR